MRFSRSSTAAVLATALPVALAQTSTSCDPTKKSCPSDTGLNAATYSADFTQGSSANASWSAAAYTTINYGSQGAEFSIAQSGQAPTIQTDFYMFFGRVDVKMRAAPGTGIVSSIVLESDDLDEIDWEFLGGDTTQVQSNFFGKGNTTSYDRVQYITVSSPQTTFHTYSIDWNQDRLQWIIDGTVVRTLSYSDALTNGGINYPQTPMRLKLGNWCGGCDGSPAGTVQWAGGNTTFDNAPYTMYVESVEITNQNPANVYDYGDMTGSWESIKVNGKATGNYNTGSGSNSNSTASGSSSASATTGSVSGASSVPTSSISVMALSQANVAVSTTITGSAYSTNEASISAQNTASTLSTQVPGQATGTSKPGHSSTSSTTGSGTTSGSAASAASTGGSSNVKHALTGASLLSVALGFFML